MYDIIVILKIYRFMLYLFILLDNVLTVTSIYIFSFNMTNYIE